MPRHVRAFVRRNICVIKYLAIYFAVFKVIKMHVED